MTATTATGRSGTARTHPPAPVPVRRSALARALSDTVVITQRHLRQIPRTPELLVFSTIQPVMFVLLFRYVFGGAIRVPGISYVDFLMAGVFVQTVAFGSVTTGVGIAEDLTKGLVDRFRSLPMSRLAVLTGKTIADLVRNTAVVVVMLAVGLLVGFRPHGSVLGWVAGGALLMLFSFAFSWVAASAGMLSGSVEAAQSAGFIWLFPLTFASSAFVPTESMPGWLQAFSRHQPVTLTVDALRGLLLGRHVGSAGWLSLVWSLGLLAVFMPLSVRLYRRAAAR